MAPCPQVFHGYSAPGGRENGSDVGSRGKRAVRCVAGRASSTPTRAQGPWEPGLISQEWGALPGGRLVLGGPAPRMPGPTSWPETSQPWLGTKPSPGGLPPVLPSGKGVPFPDGRTGGIFAVGGTGRRGLRLCRHVGQLLAPRPRVSGPHGGRGPLIAGCRCPAGVKGRRGHSPGERGRLGPERSPGKIPSPGPRGSSGLPRLLPWGLVLLTRAQVRRR